MSAMTVKSAPTRHNVIIAPDKAVDRSVRWGSAHAGELPDQIGDGGDFDLFQNRFAPQTTHA